MFIGREGEQPAKKVYPVLQAWVESRDARQAVWHAGQILRAAKLFPLSQLKDFYAMVVYHACLVLWTYGVINRTKLRAQPELLSTQISLELFLDGPESMESQRFIAVGGGTSRLKGPRNQDGTSSTASLEDPKECMELGLEILEENFNCDRQLLPAIIASLSHLLKRLGSAAVAVESM